MKGRLKMPLKPPTVSGPLGLRKKSYVLQVEYKSFWPTFERLEYHYHDVREVMAHMEWLMTQVAGQNGKGAKRQNVVTAFIFFEHLRSKRLDRRLPPIAKFVRPKGRNKPAGGKSLIEID
jgi:hypothetical protein